MERRAVRCAIYTRQSVARPGSTDFTSCDAQRDACLAMVRAHAPEGWIPLEERFDDAGESGATTDRPALTRLLDQIASSGADCVVVHRLDRLTRSVADWARLAGAFKRRGTKLVVVAGDIHLGDLAMSDLVLNVLATFAQFEREIIGERLRDARAGLRRRGLRNAGRVPFGYKADPLSHQLVVQPAEAPVVKRMFAMAPRALRRQRSRCGSTRREKTTRVYSTVDSPGARRQCFACWATARTSVAWAMSTTRTTRSSTRTCSSELVPRSRVAGRASQASAHSRKATCFFSDGCYDASNAIDS